MTRLSLLFAFCLAATRATFIEETIHYGYFPDDFIWSAASASYQVEGAVDVDGRSPSIWDTFVRIPGTIADGSTADDSCKSYLYYQKDVDLLKALGVSHYRFSISWSRLLPNGTGPTNPAGVNYYRNLIYALKDAGIEPLVTLYHWDLPQVLQDLGGWLNPDIANWFEYYADTAFGLYGANVSYWFTVNEPWVTSYLGHGVGSMAPGIKQSGTADYKAGHNQLLAHARAYRLYEKKYRPTQKGKVGIVLNCDWSEPADNSTASIAAAERNLQFTYGWFASPIWSGTGDYPQIMKDQIGRKSTAAGLSQSRLPQFTEAEKQALNGSSDFFAFNFYSAGYIENHPNDDTLVGYDTDKDTATFQDKENWYGSASEWLRITPWALRKMLKWISKTYNNPPIMVTENGWSDENGYLDDSMRVYYYKYYINNILQAIDIDKVNVIGYAAWSLLDNFEWASGYTERFGMHYVNFSDPLRPRTPKSSAVYFARLIEKNGFVPEKFCDSKLT